jgi:hypothetical protein
VGKKLKEKEVERRKVLALKRYFASSIGSVARRLGLREGITRKEKRLRGRIKMLRKREKKLRSVLADRNRALAERKKALARSRRELAEERLRHRAEYIEREKELRSVLADRNRALAERKKALARSRRELAEERLRHRAKYIVSDEYRFVYFVIPKVASSSILSSLVPFFDYFDASEQAIKDLAKESMLIDHKGLPIAGPDTGPHKLFSRSPFQINKQLLLDGMDNVYHKYFKFTFVRNPWDRLLSCYMSKVVQERFAWSFKSYSNVAFREDMSFEEFAEVVCRIPDEEANPHFCSQHIFMCSRGSRKDILADFVGRFENLEEDFAFVTKRIGIDARLPHAADTASIRSSRSYRDFYDEKLAEMVGERYREDIEIFGYSF